MRLITSEKLLPHTCKGEGHFVAVFEKSSTAEREISRIKTAMPNVRRDSEKAYREFEKQFFKSPFAKRIYETDGTLYELPDGVFEWKGLQVLRVGVRLGDVRNGRFEPSHSLARATRGEDCKNVVSLSETDASVRRYLRGETIAVEIPNGWCLVCVDGYPLGLGKAVNGTVKNHFPKALRH